jgi:L,D-transpeptidase YnhG
LPHSARAESKPFEDALAAWRNAKSSGNIDHLLRFYTTDFNTFGKKTLTEWVPELRDELDKARGRNIQLKDLSYLRWTDVSDTMVVTFGEVTDGSLTGPTKRQYWVRQGSEWKIFFEGIIG